MWNNIESKEDLETFMNINNKCKCFSVIELCYQANKVNSLIMKLQSNNKSNIMELRFDDINELSLKPPKYRENEERKGFTVMMESNQITWFDSSVNDEDYEILYCQKEVTWVKAKKLGWRKL